MLFKTDGFPKQISEHIDLPPIEDLLLMPFMSYVQVEEALKNGTDFQKYVINKTPITNTKKRVYISWNMLYLTPKVSPVINEYDLDKEWHVDANTNVTPQDVIFHLMVNNTSSLTDFNTTPFSVEVEDSNDLIKKIYTKDSFESKILSPKKIEPNKIITFDNTHVHRANRTTKTEFRLMYRVVETDSTHEDGNSQYGRSYVFNGNRRGIANIIQHIQYGKVQKIDIFRGE